MPTDDDITLFQEFIRERARDDDGHGTLEIDPEYLDHLPADLPDDYILIRVTDREDGWPRFTWAKLRTCRVCGARAGADRPDACLGTLPGVRQACCGHGDRRKAYILYETGLIVRGFVLQQRPNAWGERLP